MQSPPGSLTGGRGALVGVTIATQGVLADFGAPAPIVLTDAVDVTLGY